MGNSPSKCKGEVDKPQEKKRESEIMKAPYYNASQKFVDASTQVTPDNVSIASDVIKDLPLPEQVTATERDDNKSNASGGTTCSSVLVPAEEETAWNIEQK